MTTLPVNPSQTATSQTPSGISLASQLPVNVIDDKYGNDAARFKALARAGYDARLVQQIVNGMLLDD